MPRRKYRVGDVFKFQIDENRHGYGQIVAGSPKELRYFVFYDIATSEELDLEAVVSSKILILTQTMETKLDRGDWQIVGNAPVPRQVFPLPEYKVSLRDGGDLTWVVASYDGTILRRATQEELSTLKFQSSFSSAAVVHAVQAHFGLVERDPFYDKILATAPPQ